MTFAQLRSDIASWLVERDDVEAALRIWVKLCEANNRRLIRIPPMDALFEGFDESKEFDLPEGFVEPVSIWNEGDYGNAEVVLRAPHTVHSDSFDRTAISYAIENDKIVFEPLASTTIKMIYCKGFAPLVHDDDTNWLLENAYDVYLYGSLAHSAAWLGDDARMPMWKQAYAEAVSELVRTEKKSRYTGSALKRATSASR